MADGNEAHRRRGPLSVLRHRDFRRMWVANVVSDVGTWMQLVTVATLVAAKTGSALQTGLVAVATFAPQALTSPIAGVLADRHERRRLYLMILAAQAVGASALAFAVAAGASPRMLTLVVLCQGLIGSMANPVAAAILPELVPKRELLAAASLSSVSWNSGRIIGPMLAALSVAAIGPTWSIVANAVSFVFLFVSIASIRRKLIPLGGNDAGFVTRLRGGASAIYRSKPSLFAFAIAVATQFFIAPFIGLVPFYARQVLDGGQSDASILYVAVGVGALVGSLSLPWLVGRVGRPRTAVALLSLAIIALAVVANVKGRVGAVVGLGLLGGLYIPGFVGLSSVLPRDARPEERGRVASLFAASTGAAYSCGVVWMGALADRTSIRTSFTVGASVAAVLLGISVITANRHWRSVGRGDPASVRAVHRGLTTTVRPSRDD